MKKKEMIIGAYISYGTGHHPASWRESGVNAAAALDIDTYANLARVCEKGLADLLFLADTPSVFQDNMDGYGSRVSVLEPLSLLSYLASQTQNIGLVATASTTYKHPYNIAREFASLDYISNGRAGWNLVTSSKSDAAKNFGLAAHPEHSKRYDMAWEAWQVISGLWDSWEDNALVRNKTSGQFFVKDKYREINFEGEYFNVKGPLNIARPPQGYPVIVQAGSSEEGKELAAKTADIVFTAQNNIEDAKKFYDDLKGRMEKYGRSKSELLILPGLSFYIASDESKARKKLNDLNALIPQSFGLSMLSDLLGGVDLKNNDPEGPLPDLPKSNGNQSRQKIIIDLARKEKLSIKQLYEKIIISRGHYTFTGSYQDLADEMIKWVENEACDGFNIMPPLMPESLINLFDHVIPLIQARGWYKKSYSTGTLREKLGLKRPTNKLFNQ